MFLGLPDPHPDPLFRGTDPRIRICRSASGSVRRQDVTDPQHCSERQLFGSSSVPWYGMHLKQEFARHGIDAAHFFILNKLSFITASFVTHQIPVSTV
jgi:hypothetical protein